MPRGSSRSSSSSKPVSRPSSRPQEHHHAPAPSHHAAPPPPAAPRVAAPPPAAAPAPHHPPAQAPSSGGGMLSGLGATMAQGFAFGTGSAVARHAVNSVFDAFSGDKKESAPAPTPAPAAPQMTQQPQFSGPCATDQFAFANCLKENPTNASMCDQYFNNLQACQSRL